MKVKISIVDDAGKTYEGEIELSQGKSHSKQGNKLISATKGWYKSGGTTEKVVTLANEGFFDKNRILNDIVEELKSKDYHLKPSELTMTMRVIVRKGLLKKTRDLPDGTKSKKWTYIKN
jgi:hypothetical protein